MTEANLSTGSNSVLLHSCCAHCAAYTIDYWRKQGYEVICWWYNPNIHPFREHQSRLEAMQSLARNVDAPFLVADGYDMVTYFRQVAGHEADGDRCQYCFRLRLARAAETARQMGIAAFTTTLLISPHQKHELVCQIGQEVAAATGIEFLYADLRKRYSDSRHITKPMDLYRQQYCGCLYSEWERFSLDNRRP
ncbi:MAG: epoxyqueuosine reductase QueH [Chloroflexi bacterium]|nr:epoxyqueuosine reductase QueH [Chloroflexota bacterium]